MSSKVKDIHHKVIQMALNGSKTQAIEERRFAVAQLRVRGATIREITEQLAARGMVNHRTKKPWAIRTIQLDIDAVTRQWRYDAQAEIIQHKAQQLAEIRAARRLAWNDKNLSEVRQLIKLEIELLGTDAPIRIEHSWKDEIISALSSGYLLPEDVQIAYHDQPDLVNELFVRAGVSSSSENI